jgi:hypothetical protein
LVLKIAGKPVTLKTRARWGFLSLRRTGLRRLPEGGEKLSKGRRPICARRAKPLGRLRFSGERSRSF